MVYKQFPCLGLHIDRYDLQRRIVRKNASMRPQNDELVLCSIESNELRIALLRLTTADNKLLRDSKDRLCAYSDHKTRAMREGYCPKIKDTKHPHPRHTLLGHSPPR